MASEAQNFKEIGSKGYKVWRILRSPGPWAQIYRDREKKLRDFRTALIFPEQLLGLNQDRIYRVNVTRNSGDCVVTSQIHAIRRFRLHGFDIHGHDNLLYGRAEIFDHETVTPLKSMGVGGSGGDRSFHAFAWFSGSEDAQRYQQREQRALLG